MQAISVAKAVPARAAWGATGAAALVATLASGMQAWNAYRLAALLEHSWCGEAAHSGAGVLLGHCAWCWEAGGAALLAGFSLWRALAQKEAALR